MLITNAQVDELLDTLSGLSGLDPELAEACGSLIRSERYDDAVIRAFVLLEGRLREVLGVRGGSGRNLVQKLFSSKDTQYTDRLRLPPDEVEGLGKLFDGAFAAFRNRAAHTVAGYTLDEARAIVHLVNLLLLILDQIHRASTLQVPEDVAQALGPTVTERLELFLSRLPTIGIGQEEGKSANAYWTTMERKAPNWEESKPYRTTVLYLTMVAGKPALAFQSTQLSQVVGLDIHRLEAELLRAGCIRGAAKDTPVRLLLSECNDQATFDRIFEIVRGLMERHRV